MLMSNLKLTSQPSIRSLILSQTSFARRKSLRCTSRSSTSPLDFCVRTRFCQKLTLISSPRSRKEETKSKDSKCQSRSKKLEEGLSLPPRECTSQPPLLPFNPVGPTKPPEKETELCLSNQASPGLPKSPRLRLSSPSPRKLTKKIRGNSDQGKTTDPCKSFATSAKSRSREECRPGREPLKSLTKACPK